MDMPSLQRDVDGLANTARLNGFLLGLRAARAVVAQHYGTLSPAHNELFDLMMAADETTVAAQLASNKCAEPVEATP